MNLQKVLLGVFFASGLVVAFLLPPAAGPDENHHWMVVEQITPGFAASPENCSYWFMLPEYFEFKRIAGSTSEKMESGKFDRAPDVLDKKCFERFGISFNIFVYPVQLLLKVVSGSSFGPLRTIEFFYLSRLINLLLVGLVLFRVVTRQGNGLTVSGLYLTGLFLTPIAIQQSTVISTDPMIFVFCLLIIYMSVRLEKSGFPDYILLAVSGAAVLFPKPIFLLAYLPLIVRAAFDVNRQRAGGGRIMSIRMTGLLGIVLLHGIIAASGALFFRELTSHTLRAGVDPAAVMRLIFEPPFLGLLVLIKSIFSYLSPSALLEPLGSLNVAVLYSVKESAISLWWIVVVTSMFLLVRFIKNCRVIRREMLLIGIACFVSAAGLAVLSALGMYLYWTPVAAATSVVEGLQARYFIPPLILASGMLLAVDRSGDIDPQEQQSGKSEIRRFEPFAIGLSVVFGGQFLTGLAVSFLRRFW